MASVGMRCSRTWLETHAGVGLGLPCNVRRIAREGHDDRVWLPCGVK